MGTLKSTWQLATVVFAIALIAASTFAQPALATSRTTSAVPEARKALEMWEPLSIHMKGSSLVIVAKERRVTSRIYNAMMSGICAYAGTGRITLAGVKEIVILNRFGASGWVFEGGTPECKRLVNVPVSKLDLLIGGQTHTYACTTDRGCKY